MSYGTYIFHADMAQTLELLHAHIDERHRSYLAAVEGQELHEVRSRVAKELLHLDDLFEDGEDRRHHRLPTSAAAMVVRAIRHSTSPNKRGALSARDVWDVGRG
jgi:hypothetical protein